MNILSFIQILNQNDVTIVIGLIYETSKVAKLRRITQEEFNAVMKYGITKGRIDDPSLASLRNSSVANGEAIIKSKTGKLIFCTDLDYLSYDEEKVEKQSKVLPKKISSGEQRDINSTLVGFTSVVVVLGVIGVGISNLMQRQQRYVNNLDYRSPVRSYKYTNELFDEIDSNKFRFKQDVNGEIVKIQGYIGEKSIQDDYFVIEGYGTMLPPTVSCYPRKELMSKMANLSAGKTVEIIGVVDYTDSPWDSVDLDHCVFTSNVYQRGSSDLSDVLKSVLGKY